MKKVMDSKRKAIIKKQLSEEYYGKEAKDYNSIRSATPGRKQIVNIKNKIFTKLLNKAKGKKILDVACGTGRFLHLYGDREIHGIDISSDQLKEARKLNLAKKLTVADAENIPYPDNFFDVVITSQFIEHIPQYEQVIKEMVRVTKPKGSLIIDFPNKHSLTYLPTKFRILKGKLRHLNLFTKKQIINLSKKNNLQIKDYENTVIITPNIFPGFFQSIVSKINSFFIKKLPQYGYLHYVRFQKREK